MAKVKRIVVEVDADVHKRLKEISLYYDRPIRHIVEALVKKYILDFDKKGKSK